MHGQRTSAGTGDAPGEERVSGALAVRTTEPPMTPLQPVGDGPAPELPPQVPLGRVVVVSGDRRLGEAWASNLRGHGATRAVQVCETLTEAAGPGPDSPADLVVVDADLLGDCHGLPGAGARTVVLGDPGRGAPVRVALTAGARGFLFGHRPSRQPVAVGPVPKAWTCRVVDVNGVPQILTHREVQIARHVADGASNAEIGGLLGVSPMTVKSHLARIGRRLGTRDRAQLVLLALRSGAFV